MAEYVPFSTIDCIGRREGGRKEGRERREGGRKEGREGSEGGRQEKGGGRGKQVGGSE